ncbi:hypothetical protein DY000_02009184 [Brassica cretica]|uniref:BRX domain-containing protein n=1 Tax=Brassica cretica TaxID=69181 RepID=A0ABQ7CBQ7_BRACR|nr:hypothetical protein DY000_02009184 [Brassica cretica]
MSITIISSPFSHYGPSKIEVVSPERFLCSGQPSAPKSELEKTPWWRGFSDNGHELGVSKGKRFRSVAHTLHFFMQRRRSKCNIVKEDERESSRKMKRSRKKYVSLHWRKEKAMTYLK